ncbi:hypothetical protein Tco_0635914, partial [Tanacetum coccineum]
LVAESYDWDEESMSTDDEGVTTFKALMVIADEELSIKRVDASRVTLDQLLSEQIPGNIVRTLGGQGKRKEKISPREIVFSKSKASKTVLEITSDSETEQRPLPPLPKLTGAELANSSKIPSLTNLTLTKTVPKKTHLTSEKVSTVRGKIGSKPPSISESYLDKNIDLTTKKLLLTLMEEVKGLKEHIKLPIDTSPFESQSSRSKSAVGKQRPWFGPCKHYGFKNHLLEDCYMKPTCSTCGSNEHLTKEHPELIAVQRTLTKLKAQSSQGSARKVKKIPKLYIPCKYCGFNNHHFDECEFYPGFAYVNGLKHNLISISQLCDANFKVLFTKTQGTIFNQYDEVVLIAPKRRDVYVIDMSSYNEESNDCFFAKASPSVNWL